MSCESENILKQAENLKKTKGRIDIIEMANSLGIKVFTSSQMKVPSFIAYDKDKKRYEIYVNAREKVERQRFSIAHEIAHFIEHKEKITELGIVGRQNTYSLTAKEELQADNLAAEILMPEEYVMKYLKEYKISNKDYLDEKFVKSCAKNFDVTPPAMNIRLKNLGYKVPYLK